MPDDLDLGAVAAELQDRHVERLHRTDVPDMRAADVDDDTFGRLAEVEGIDEILGRAVEQLPFDA